jgi:mannose-6-phosphate isomerase-like protein (cupin superfamily)
MKNNNLATTIENPLIGDRVTFLPGVDGEYEHVEVYLAPGGGNGLHYHTTYVEEFQAVQGNLHLEVDGEIVILQPGEKAEAPIRSLHRFFNPSESEAIIFHTKIIPARNFENMLRIAYGLANDGKVTNKGVPKSVLDMAVLFHLGESYMPGIPISIQKGIFSSLYNLAKLTGTEKRLLQQYCY